MGAEHVSVVRPESFRPFSLSDKWNEPKLAGWLKRYRRTGDGYRCESYLSYVHASQRQGCDQEMGWNPIGFVPPSRSLSAPQLELIKPSFGHKKGYEGWRICWDICDGKLGGWTMCVCVCVFDIRQDVSRDDSWHWGDNDTCQGGKSNTVWNELLSPINAQTYPLTL